MTSGMHAVEHLCSCFRKPYLRRLRPVKNSSTSLSISPVDTEAMACILMLDSLLIHVLSTLEVSLKKYSSTLCISGLSLLPYASVEEYVDDYRNVVSTLLDYIVEPDAPSHLQSVQKHVYEMYEVMDDFVIQGYIEHLKGCIKRKSSKRLGVGRDLPKGLIQQLNISYGLHMHPSNALSDTTMPRIDEMIIFDDPDHSLYACILFHIFGHLKDERSLIHRVFFSKAKSISKTSDLYYNYGYFLEEAKSVVNRYNSFSCRDFHHLACSGRPRNCKDLQKIMDFARLLFFLKLFVALAANRSIGNFVDQDTVLNCVSELVKDPATDNHEKCDSIALQVLTDALGIDFEVIEEVPCHSGAGIQGACQLQSISISREGNHLSILVFRSPDHGYSTFTLSKENAKTLST